MLHRTVILVTAVALNLGCGKKEKKDETEVVEIVPVGEDNFIASDELKLGQKNKVKASTKVQGNLPTPYGHMIEHTMKFKVTKASVIDLKDVTSSFICDASDGKSESAGAFFTLYTGNLSMGSNDKVADPKIREIFFPRTTIAAGEHTLKLTFYSSKHCSSFYAEFFVDVKDFVPPPPIEEGLVGRWVYEDSLNDLSVKRIFEFAANGAVTLTTDVNQERVQDFEFTGSTILGNENHSLTLTVTKVNAADEGEEIKVGDAWLCLYYVGGVGNILRINCNSEPGSSYPDSVGEGDPFFFLEETSKL